MPEGSRDNVSHLKLVEGNGPAANASNDREHIATRKLREVDWTILMARAQGGDSAAYVRLLEETAPYLRALASRSYRNDVEIEDAIQDVFLTLHSIRHTYDPARPFGPWLVAIARRHFIDRLRRQGRQRARETPLSAEHETFEDVAANIDRDMDRSGLHAAIERLPARQREAISLLKLKEMSLKEAAMTTGLSIASLKVATHRALKSLREILTDGKDS